MREDRRVECGRGRPTPAVRRARTAEHWLDPACSRWRVGERSGAGHQWHFPARCERAHRHAHTHLVFLKLPRPESTLSCDDHRLRLMSCATRLKAHHLEEPLTRVETDGLHRQVVGSTSAAPSTLFNTPAAKASRRSMTPTHVGHGAHRPRTVRGRRLVRFQAASSRGLSTPGRAPSSRAARLARPSPRPMMLALDNRRAPRELSAPARSRPESSRPVRHARSSLGGHRAPHTWTRAAARGAR